MKACKLRRICHAFACSKTKQNKKKYTNDKRFKFFAKEKNQICFGKLCILEFSLPIYSLNLIHIFFSGANNAQFCFYKKSEWLAAMNYYS